MKYASKNNRPTTFSNLVTDNSFQTIHTFGPKILRCRLWRRCLLKSIRKSWRMKLQSKRRSDWSVIRFLLLNLGHRKQPNSTTWNNKPFSINNKLIWWGKNLSKNRGLLMNKLSIWIWWARKNKSSPINATNYSKILINQRCRFVPFTAPRPLQTFFKIHKKIMVN